MTFSLLILLLLLRTLTSFRAAEGGGSVEKGSVINAEKLLGDSFLLPFALLSPSAHTVQMQRM